MNKFCISILVFLLLTSCKYKHHKNNDSEDVKPKISVKEITIDKAPKEYQIDTVNTSKQTTPLGYENIKVIRSVTDTIPDIYGDIFNNFQKSIGTLNFKNRVTEDKELLKNIIVNTKDSSNIAIYHDYYSRLDKRSYFLSDTYIEVNDLKLFFLKTIYSKKNDGKKGIENIYLVSTKNRKIIDLLNVYYHYERAHMMESRFFYIDNTMQITSAIYTNIEGEISVRGYKEFIINNDGFFKSKH